MVCLNDRVAMGTYQALATNGLDVPRDVAVVSFDGSELATWLRPAVTSVALPFAELGERAVQVLLDPRPSAGEVVRVPMGVAPWPLPSVLAGPTRVGRRQRPRRRPRRDPLGAGHRPP